MSDTAPSEIRNAKSEILRAQGLHKHYVMGGEDLHILRGVDLSLARGEWLAVLGASGSGKSTLLHLLGGLDNPDEGSVRFEDHDIFAEGSKAVDEYRNRRVGFVFQFYHLLPELNVLENILLASMIGSGLFDWPGHRPARKERALQLIERLGLSHRVKHKPSRLSGGERQRVAIGRALINQPDLLLADEPTGNLDAKTGGEIIEVFRELHAQGQTIVMVTHDVNIAANADRRMTLEYGQLKL